MKKSESINVATFPGGYRGEDDFLLLADNAPVLIWCCGTDKLCDWFNTSWLRFTGRTMQQELGNGWTDGVHRKDLDRCLETYISAFDRREEFSRAYRLRRYDGVYRWILDNGRPFYSRGGTFRGYFGSCIDVHESKNNEIELQRMIANLKRSKAELQVSEERWRSSNLRLDAALNNMSQGLCMFDSEGRLVLCNERYIQMYRLPRDAVKPGCTIRELLALRKASGTFWGDVEEYSTNLRARIAEGRTFNSIVETADGRVTVIVDHPIEGGGWVATFEDITERRRVEQERDRSQKFLNTILENAPIPIFVKEANGLRYVLVNRAGEKFWGTSRAEMIGKTSHDVFPKEEADLIAARDKQLLQSDQPFFDERQIRTPRNGIRSIVSKKLTVCDDDGKSRYVIGVIEDVTERKQVEKRIAHMAHQVIHLNRIAIAGVMSASFAHELNQPLGSILSNVEAAEVLLAANPLNLGQFKEILADVRRDGQRAGEIIKQLGGLLKKGDEIELQEFDLNDAVQCALHLLDHEAMTRDVVLGIRQAQAALPVCANVVHVQQVILNLAMNGMDAMAYCDPGSRKLTLETAVAGEADVEVSVSDSGTGIPADKLERIFDTFVTTKPQGTGLGLSIARTIVENSRREDLGGEPTRGRRGVSLHPAIG